MTVEEKKQEYYKNVISNGNLPKIFQYKFKDGEDQRIWFNSISVIPSFNDYLEKIDELLLSLGHKRLSDLEREKEFLAYLEVSNHIPVIHERFFEDNLDMRIWYDNYRVTNVSFETVASNSLRENQEFNVADIWPLEKQELTFIIKKLKRFPKYQEVKLQNGVDANVLIEKLKTLDPQYLENAKIYLVSLNNKSLSYEEKAMTFLKMVETLGYLPSFQEKRFSDGIDMYTWYNKVKSSMKELEIKVNDTLNSLKPKKINIYFVPKFKNKTGKFYEICSNEGEVLDISSLTSDPTFKRNGTIKIDLDEEIGDVYFEGKTR